MLGQQCFFIIFETKFIIPGIIARNTQKKGWKVCVLSGHRIGVDSSADSFRKSHDRKRLLESLNLDYRFLFDGISGLFETNIKLPGAVLTFIRSLTCFPQSVTTYI